MIKLQAIQVEWTKKSRGAPGATRRNAIPESFPFPESEAGAILLHELRFSEWDGFVARESVEQWSTYTRYRGLAFQPRSCGEVLVSYGYERWYVGAPARASHKTPLFTLTRGQWGKFVINGRIASTCGWSYRKFVANIANFEKPRPLAFTDTKPAYVIDKQENLF